MTTTTNKPQPVDLEHDELDIPENLDRRKGRVEQEEPAVITGWSRCRSPSRARSTWTSSSPSVPPRSRTSRRCRRRCRTTASRRRRTSSGCTRTRTKYWSPELCFVNVPIKGQKRDTLHLIDEDLAMRYLPSGEDPALPPGARDQALRRLLPVPRPDAERGQPLERDQPGGMRAGQDAVDAGDEPQGGRRRRLQDRLRPRPRRLPRAEVADAIARRADRARPSPVA